MILSTLVVRTIMNVVVFLPKVDFTERQLELIGPATFYGEKVTSEKDLIRKCLKADAVLATQKRTGNLTPNFFNSLPNLKFVSIYSTGYDFVDLKAAKAQGVTVSYCPGYCTSAVAEWTISMIQKLCKPHAGKTLGIIGLGRIGQAVAATALQIGMKVVAWDRIKKTTFQVSLEKLLRESDVVSIHLALNDQTQGFIGEKEIAMMKTGAALINSAREGLVDNKALVKSLKTNKLRGAAIDLDHQSKTNIPKAITTQHIAWNNTESFKVGDEMFVQNLVKWRNGEPQNVLV